MLHLWQISRKINLDSLATQLCFQNDLKEYNTFLIYITVVLGQAEIGLSSSVLTFIKLFDLLWI